MSSIIHDELGSAVTIKEIAMTSRELKEAIEQLRAQISELNRKLWTLEEECPHDIQRHYNSMHCVICGEDFGWWCPNSPDHYCHYDKGNDDSCDYCGQPDERK
jgi:hypothetical protein